MADITSLVNSKVTIEMTTAVLVAVMEDHIPQVAHLDEGGDFYGCSCGWDEDAEVIVTDSETIKKIADFVGVELTGKALQHGEIRVPSPNPLVSHILDVIVHGTTTRRSLNVSSQYGSGQVQ